MPPATTLVALDEPGAYVLEDNGDPDDGIAVLRGPDGGVSEILIPLSLLKIIASAPGVALTVNLAESLGSARLTVGDLVNSAVSPESIILDNLVSDNTVTLVANGRITEAGLDEPADVIAPRLIMSAGTGLGLVFNSLDLQ